MARPSRLQIELSGDRVARAVIDLSCFGVGGPVIAIALSGRVLEIEALPPVASPTIEPLSIREREVALLVTRGLGNREIAARLGIKYATVACHLIRVYRKLGVAGRVELTARVLGAEPITGARVDRRERAQRSVIR